MSPGVLGFPLKLEATETGSAPSGDSLPCATKKSLNNVGS